MAGWAAGRVSGWVSLGGWVSGREGKWALLSLLSVKISTTYMYIYS